MKILLSTLTFIFLIGCANEPKPWEKGELAKDEMQLGGADSLQSQVNEHVFSSKEGSFGGGGVGGGGCGCNWTNN